MFCSDACYFFALFCDYCLLIAVVALLISLIGGGVLLLFWSEELVLFVACLLAAPDDFLAPNLFVRWFEPVEFEP